MKPTLSHLRKHKLCSHLKTSTRECKLSRLPVADTDALGDNCTDIPDCLLRTCDWSRTWPSEACDLQKAFGESSKRQASNSIECCKLVEHSFEVPDGVRIFQDSDVRISVALLPKLMMLPRRDASYLRGRRLSRRFFYLLEPFQCSQDATLFAGMCVCVCLALSLL
jgi:hypothetical protein